MGSSISCQPVSCQPAIQKCQASGPCALVRDPNEASITGIHCPSSDAVDLPNGADAIVRLQEGCRCHGPNGFCSQPVQVEATSNGGRSNFLQPVEEDSDSEIDLVAAEVDAQVRGLEADDWLPESSRMKDVIKLAASVAAETSEDMIKLAAPVAVETGGISANEDTPDMTNDFHEANAMVAMSCEPAKLQEKEVCECPAMEKVADAQDGSTSPHACPAASKEEGQEKGESRRQPEEEPGAEPPPAAAELPVESECAEEDDSSHSPPMKLFHISSTMELCAESEDAEDAAVDQKLTPPPVAPPSLPAKPKSGRSKNRKTNQQRANELLLW
eukprot:TRINITY_DN21095_c0_g2_i1.p1 TRINITY_DN21095_c0_g2~~TRINITY_DN21095_c0_g2_i1.p1  ORF type:complete len:329 (-),score=88.46 TRINITY_DN21095_c0_g2_i1:73-1059(-)